MPIRLTPCQHEICDIRFKVRKIHKPYIGMYRGKPVFHWHYYCPNGHYQFVRFWNEYVNGIYEKVIMLEMGLITYRKDEKRVRELEKELIVARDELDRVNDEVREEINKKEAQFELP